MGTTLCTYPSGSNPAKVYSIILGNDGVTYCDCMGWKMNKHCKHLDNYLATGGINCVRAIQSKPVRLATKEPEPTLNKTIELIVDEIRRGAK